MELVKNYGHIIIKMVFRLEKINKGLFYQDIKLYIHKADYYITEELTGMINILLEKEIRKSNFDQKMQKQK